MYLLTKHSDSANIYFTPWNVVFSVNFFQDVPKNVFQSEPKKSKTTFHIALTSKKLFKTTFLLQCYKAWRYWTRKEVMLQPWRKFKRFGHLRKILRFSDICFTMGLYENFFSFLDEGGVLSKIKWWQVYWWIVHRTIMDNILMMHMMERHLKCVQGLVRYGQIFTALYGQKLKKVKQGSGFGTPNICLYLCHPCTNFKCLSIMHIINMLSILFMSTIHP